MPIRARVIKEVVIGKEVAEKIKTRRETLRRTDMAIEEVPGARRFDDSAADCRSYYTQRLAQKRAFRQGVALAPFKRREARGQSLW